MDYDLQILFKNFNFKIIITRLFTITAEITETDFIPKERS